VSTTSVLTPPPPLRHGLQLGSVHHRSPVAGRAEHFPKIRTDLTKINQILFLLLDNAMNYYDAKIAWYENRGGQFALATADTAPVLVLEGDSSDLLETVMTHRGRAADGDAELATLQLLFEETPAIRSRAPRRGP